MDIKQQEKHKTFENLKNLFNQFLILTLQQLLTPIIHSLGRFGNSFMSINDVTTPSNVPNCESIPRVKSIKKNSTAHNCAPGNWFIASVNIINAKPVPEAL